MVWKKSKIEFKFLAVKKRSKKQLEQYYVLSAGVGKTSLGKSIARATKDRVC